MIASPIEAQLSGVALLLAAIAAFVLAVAIAWVLIRRGFAHLDAKVTTKFGSLETKIEQTHVEAQTAAQAAAEAALTTAKEFKPNGGSSARDAIDRLEKSVANVLASQADVLANQADLAARMGAVEEYITTPKETP